jgi:hypothetical protein
MKKSRMETDRNGQLKWKIDTNIINPHYDGFMIFVSIFHFNWPFLSVSILLFFMSVQGASEDPTEQESPSLKRLDCLHQDIQAAIRDIACIRVFLCCVYFPFQLAVPVSFHSAFFHVGSRGV